MGIIFKLKTNEAYGNDYSDPCGYKDVWEGDIGLLNADIKYKMKKMKFAFTLSTILAFSATSFGQNTEPNEKK